SLSPDVMSRAPESQSRNRNPGCCRGGARYREQSGLGGIHDAGIAVEAVGNGGKIVAQAVVQRELRRRLPVVKNKEAVAPLRCRTLNAGRRCCVGGLTAERKVGAGIASNASVENELPERYVGRDSPRIQFAEFNARHDVVFSAGVTDLFVGIDGPVVLEPVRTVIADVHTGSSGYIHEGDAGHVVSCVEVETGDTKIRSGALK